MTLNKIKRNWILIFLALLLFGVWNLLPRTADSGIILIKTLNNMKYHRNIKIIYVHTNYIGDLRIDDIKNRTVEFLSQEEVDEKIKHERKFRYYVMRIRYLNILNRVVDVSIYDYENSRNTHWQGINYWYQRRLYPGWILKDAIQLIT